MKNRYSLLLVLLCSTMLFAQSSNQTSTSGQQTRQDVHRVGHGISSPRAIKTPDPVLTAEQRKELHNLQTDGIAMVWLIVDRDGNPKDVSIVRGLSPDLDQRAIEAVRKWKFRPAQKDGEPVEVQINVELNFKTF